MDSSNELITLDNHDYMNKMVVQSLHSIERLGKELYSKYVNDVLTERKTSIHKAIKTNQQPSFKRRRFTTANSKVKQQFQQMKNDSNLFSQLFIAQVRNTRLDEMHMKTIRGRKYVTAWETSSTNEHQT